MHTKIKEGLYQCTECYKTLKTEKGMLSHIRDKHEGPSLLRQAQADVEEIRTTSISIHEVIERLQDLWSSYGVEVTFSSYPSSFSYSVSNSHNAPAGYEKKLGRKS